MKEFEEDTNKCKDIQCTRTRKNDIMKISVLLKAIYRFSVISIKILMVFFSGIEKKSYNSYGTPKTPNNQRNSEKRTKLESSHFIILNYSHILIFGFVAYVMVPYPRNHCQDQCKEVFFSFFF